MMDANDTPLENDALPPQPAIEADAMPEAWVVLENGRYQPRRIRGSCLGRELG